jgi:hypothetical protein
VAEFVECHENTERDNEGDDRLQSVHGRAPGNVNRITAANKRGGIDDVL